MALSTKYVLDTQSSADQVEFDVMYTPMNTGTYKSYPRDGAWSLVGLTFEMCMLCLILIIGVTAEPKEQVIEIILKRLGVSKPVMVMRDVALYVSYGLSVLTLTAFTYWVLLYKDCLGFALWYMFTILYFVQTMGRQIALHYCIPRSVSIPVGIIFLIFQIALQQNIAGDVISHSSAVAASIISPMIQIEIIVKIAASQLRFGKRLDFGTFAEEVYPDTSAATIFTIGVIMAIFYLVFIAYIWPLRVDVDAENPAPWYYPVSCKYWRNVRQNHRDGQNTVVEFRDTAVDDDENGDLS